MNHSDHAPAVAVESTTAPVSQFTSGVVLAIVGTFLFALKSIFIKLAFAAGAEPTLLLTLRLYFALPFYIAVLWKIQRGQNKSPMRWTMIARAFGLGLLGYYLASYLDLTGLQYITAQLERLTLFTYPAIVAVLAWLFLGERLNRRIIAAIVLCYCGVILMYSQERSMTGGTHVAWGVFLVLASAISYSMYIILAKPTMQVIGSARFTSLAMIGSTVFVGIHFAATGGVDQLADTPSIVYLYGIILALVCTLLPSFMINEAIMRIGATRTVVIGSVGPVLTMVLAITILREPSSVYHFLGMFIAIIGVSLVTSKK
ncbi:DMT family transporter [Stieleria sp. TO1_6]|uniref:DMT family transporter n=1 Tax=Stieleria tagensis TaxID=2956795 RepID=UPI00209A6D55|nr:DMT family transporter [Stieleria tagensis]MCO8124483.1 DMT family transporter [Stieleria tagensis]